MLKRILLFQLEHKSVMFLCYWIISTVFACNILMMLTRDVPRQNLANAGNLPADDEMLRDHNRYLQVYEEPRSDVTVAIHAQGPDGIFNPATLEKMRQISRQMENLDDFEDVISLDTIPDVRKREAGETIKYTYDPYLHTIPDDPEEMANFKQRVKQDNLVWGKILSDDRSGEGQVGLIIGFIDNDLDEVVITEKVERLIEPFQGPEKISVYGGKPFDKTLKMAMDKSLSKLLPICFLVLILVLFLSIGLDGAIAGAIIVGFSMLWAGATMRLFHIPRTVLSENVMPMLIAVVSSYPIHLVGRYQRKQTSEFSARKVRLWIAAALSDGIKPVSLAVASTVIGFLSLASLRYRFQSDGIRMPAGGELEQLFPCGTGVFAPIIYGNTMTTLSSVLDPVSAEGSSFPAVLVA